MTEGFYSESDVLSSSRWVLSTDMKQQPPTGNLKVVKAEKQQRENGNDIPILTLQDADGTEYLFSAWARDVQPCIQEYGVTDPTTWGPVRFAKNKTGRRWMLEPGEQNAPEEKIE